MIQQFVDRWEARKHLAREAFSAKHPADYTEVVRTVVEVLTDEDGYQSPDPKNIRAIDDGDYQGTILFVVGCTGYQPSTYWTAKVSYGSCSYCDTLQGIRDLGAYDEKPNDQQVADYMTLALHIVQGLKEVA